MAPSIDLITIAHDVGPRLEHGREDRDRSAEFADANYALLREAKLFSAMIPAELGGGGASHGEMCRFLRAIARHCPSTALALSMHQHLVAAAVLNDRAGRPGRKLLDMVASDEKVLISTGANDWLESNGRARRVEGGYRVSARKSFCSGAPKGAMLVTSAAFDDPEQGPQVLHFAVPFERDGVSLAGDWDTLGMRATGSESVILDDVFVPDAAVSLRRPRGEYHPAWNVILTVALPLIMSVYAGVAEAAAEIAREHGARRPDDPVAPYVQGQLANHLAQAQIVVDDMVRLANDLDIVPDLALANAMLVRKTLAAQAVLATAETALEAMGGAGFHRRSGLELFLRDAHAAQFHPLPARRQHLFTGRIAMGLDPIGVAPTAEMRIAAE